MNSLKKQHLLKLPKNKVSKQFTLCFWIRYKTNYEENIFLTIHQSSLHTQQQIAMQYYNDAFWMVECTFQRKNFKEDIIYYEYSIENKFDLKRKEAFSDKYFNINQINKTLTIVDYWNGNELLENIFYTKPFTHFFNHKTEALIPCKQNNTYSHTFKVKAPLLPKNATICLIGNCLELGIWSTKEPLLLTITEDKNYYAININITTNYKCIEYKYGVYDVANSTFINYELGNNRSMDDSPQYTAPLILHDGFIQIPFTNWRAAGVNVPVFSLRSENSFGIGEFLDIKLLATWAAKTSIKIIQLLPINDTTESFTDLDSYPYSIISAFALHPIYINIQALFDRKNTECIEDYLDKKEKLNKLECVDYSNVLNLKWKYLRIIYNEKSTTTFNSKDYKAFFKKNEFWLKPYAVFCFLRTKYGTSNFREWQNYGIYNEDEIGALFSEANEQINEIEIHYFVQYYLHKQLTNAVNFAHKLNIALKGDIPIGVNKHSVEVWQNPLFFNVNVQAGAPPDNFSKKGQNWGFPTYNWNKMQENNFLWWKLRLTQMETYFDAYRLDHILGFCRIWTIPNHAVEGIMGFFVPAHTLHINHFSENGIFFNYHRYTEPFITNEVLEILFEEGKEYVVKNFLCKDELSDNYSLKKSYSTQKLVEEYFNKQPQNEFNLKLKNGLFNLISNVILFEVEGSNKNAFHFRFNMFETTSFKHLSSIIQQQLTKLYNNYFFVNQNELWVHEALRKMPEIKASTKMLACGEDLGLVPDFIPELMSQNGILSLEIQRMSKRYGVEFSHPNIAKYNSVVMPSTHDMSTIRSWWKENSKLSTDFFNNILNKKGDAPIDCSSEINKEIIVQHVYSPAILSIFLLQDLLGMDENIRRENADAERINIPSNALHIWNYRMHITLENLLQQKHFNSNLKKIIQLSGR